MNTTTIFLIFFHVSNLMAFLAFLLRDQLQLRLLMAVSFVMQGLYYYSVPGGPLFDPLFWKIVSFIANVGMIVLLFGGKIDFGIPDELRGLFRQIAVLTPGQFRKLVAFAGRSKPDDMPLLVEGDHPHQLYYLIRGQAEITKGSIKGLFDHEPEIHVRVCLRKFRDSAGQHVNWAHAYSSGHFGRSATIYRKTIRCYICRRTTRRILPLMVFGNSGRNSISRGYL